MLGTINPNHKNFMKKDMVVDVKSVEEKDIVVEEPTTKEETVEEVIDLYGLNKSEQVKMLKGLGMKVKDINKLKREEDRVNKIIELTE